VAVGHFGTLARLSTLPPLLGAANRCYTWTIRSFTSLSLIKLPRTLQARTFDRSAVNSNGGCRSNFVAADLLAFLMETSKRDRHLSPVAFLFDIHSGKDRSGLSLHFDSNRVCEACLAGFCQRGLQITKCSNTVILRVSFYEQVALYN
jgi:hypothetical protein